jgi:hypothetical protein
MRRIALVASPVAALALAACSPSDEAQTAPDTNATAPEGAAPAEPSVGYAPPEGGGVPGSSDESNDASNPDGTTADPVLPRETPNS